MTENEKYLYDRFLISIKSGFESLEDIIDDAFEMLDDEGWGNEISDEWIRSVLTNAYDKHLQESKTWQHPTDTEKLQKAFDKICSENIIALHNAGYTKSDAIYDVREVWHDVEDEGGMPTGYCYYHGQDLEGAINNGNLFIGFYGAHDNNEKEAILVGNKVVAALKEVGFEIEWNNTASKRIQISNFKWQNIFISEEDTEEKMGYDRVIQLMTK